MGTEFTLTAGAVSSGTLTFTLRHKPNKPNTGLSDADGETDIDATFDIEVKIDVNLPPLYWVQKKSPL